MPRMPQPPGGRPPRLPEPMRIENPLVIMFQAPDKNIVCHIHPADGIDHTSYGLLVCDLVRHVAKAFKVEEDAVWEWVDKERRRPTTQISRPPGTRASKHCFQTRSKSAKN